jgi:NDP-sugar pyrophosphorylase family protein
LHVLVTGAAGYLGSILCEHLLDAGHSVLALDTLTYGEQGELDGDGWVRSFHEKGASGWSSRARWINGGVYLCNRQALAGVPPDRASSWERDMLPRLTDGRLPGFPAAGAFLDIGTPESCAAAQSFFGRSPVRASEDGA